MKPSLKTECPDLAIPIPSPLELTQVQRYIFDKCLTPSIKHRNHGKVAICCHCFFTREVASQAFQYDQHSQILGTNEFRDKFNIKNERDFAKYCQTLDIEPQIGGSRCTQPTIENQAKEISVLKEKVEATEQTLKDHKERLQKVEDEAELLKKRVDDLEELASKYERHVINSVKEVCCDGFKYCIKCGRSTAEFHSKHLPMYKVFLDKGGRKGLIAQGPGDKLAMRKMSAKLEEFEASDPTYKLLGDGAYDAITKSNREEELEKEKLRKRKQLL